MLRFLVHNFFYSNEKKKNKTKKRGEKKEWVKETTIGRIA